MRRVELKIYSFNELSDKAKEKARDWYRSLQDSSDFQSTQDKIIGVALLCGFMEGTEVAWSVGYCQSDHATLEGRWSAKRVNVEPIKQEFPKDALLRQIVKQFAQLAWRSPALSFVTSHRHIVDQIEEPAHSTAYKDSFAAVQSLNTWAYDQLRQQADWLHSEECVDETIVANDYEFTEDGKFYP
jgi:hypothetical protein